METLLWIVCIIEFIMIFILTIIGFVPAEGTLIVDDTDPDDVKMSLIMPNDIEKSKNVIIKVKHKDSRDKK